MPSTRKPSYREAQVLMAIGPSGTVKADLTPEVFGGEIGLADVPNYVIQLRKKGLIEVGGTVRRYRAPASKVLIPTEYGCRTMAALAALSGWPHVRKSAFTKIMRGMPEPE
jgi:hypothetical protein